jgi:hypothetical protein
LAVASRKLRLARDSPLGLCAKIGLFQSSKSVFGQASISARKPIAGESNHALSRKRRCWHCKPSVPREIRLIPEHIAGSALELESNCISISLRGFFAVPWAPAPMHPTLAHRTPPGRLSGRDRPRGSGRGRDQLVIGRDAEQNAGYFAEEAGAARSLQLLSPQHFSYGRGGSVRPP